MMGRNHILTGGLALGWLAAAGVGVADHPASAVLAAELFLWGTTAPDLDAEASIASATWSPQQRAAQRLGGERLVPSARSMLGTITPGGHWLSAAMRLIARRHYHATRGQGDPESADDPHRKLWHTCVGALVMAGVVCVLLSSVGPQLLAARWPALDRLRLPDGRWWLPWLTASGPCGLMFGVVIAGWRPRTTWGSLRARGVGFVLGAATALVVGAGGGLDGQWYVWLVAVVAGCAVHVAGDKCSRHGASWWAPFLEHDGHRRWAPTGYLPGWARFRTGYGGESIFVLGLIVVSVLAWWVLLAARGVLPPAASPWALLARWLG